MLVWNGIRAPLARPFAAGFTVVEFAVTLVLMGIGLALAIPSLQSLTANNQVTAAGNTVVAGMNLARSSAITSGNNITICPSIDATTCTANRWESGWIVFNDANGNSAADAGEILRVITLEGNLTAPVFGDQIVFRSDGTTSMAADATITSCFADPNVTSQCFDVTVSAFGMIQSHQYHPE